MQLEYFLETQPSDVIEAAKQLSVIIVALIGGAAGLVTGILGTFFAPWVKSSIDRKNKLNSTRRELIKDVMEKLNNVNSMNDFIRTVEYARIRKHIEQTFVTGVESDIGCIVMGSSRYEDEYGKEKMMDQISLLEIKWRLI